MKHSEVSKNKNESHYFPRGINLKFHLDVKKNKKEHYLPFNFTRIMSLVSAVTDQ